MTDQPALWDRLVQWQPATAAEIAQHARSLPEDWPMRVFGVGRAGAALTLPPAATGEAFPDRAPEIAPYDEIAAPDDCPACREAEGTCRYHEGYAAGHHEQAQEVRDAVKANPTIGLREFMLWQSDVEEAVDRGQEPPAMPPPTGRADALEAAIKQVEQVFTGEVNDDRALDLHSALIVLRSKLPCTCARSQGLHEQGCRRYVPGHDLLSPSRRLARGRAELRRLADEAQPAEPKCPPMDPARILGIDSCPTPETHNWGCGCPSDVAAAIASCPGREMAPSPCRCPCYGCKHHCSAHNPDSLPAAAARPDDTTASPAEPESPRCARCGHPKRDHDGRADHRARHSALVAGEPWCHVCNARCDYAEPTPRPDDTKDA